MARAIAEERANAGQRAGRRVPTGSRAGASGKHLGAMPELPQHGRRRYPDGIMTSFHASFRPCPRCGVAVIGRKSDPRSGDNDTFECVLCRTVVSYPFEETRAKKTDRASP